jgi:hypothetical protein
MVVQHRTTSPIARQQQSQPRVAERQPCGRIIAIPQVGGSITVTSAPPDHRDRDPTRRPRRGPAGCRRLWRSMVASAPASLAALHISGSEDAASDPGRLNPGATATLAPMRFLTGTTMRLARFTALVASAIRARMHAGRPTVRIGRRGAPSPRLGTPSFENVKPMGRTRRRPA